LYNSPKEHICKQLYQKALKFQTDENYESAFVYYFKILNSPFVSGKEKTEKDNVQNNLVSNLFLIFQFLYLKYLSLKNVGFIFMKQEKTKESVDYLLESIKIDDRDAVVWFYLGKMSLKLNKYFLSRISFEKCISMNSFHLPAWNYLMELLFEIGDFEDCKVVVEKILEMNPKDENALKYRNYIGKKSKMEFKPSIVVEYPLEEAAEKVEKDFIEMNSLKSFLIQLIELYNHRNQK
jgi:tetratricopeptide (TPR) repeat protein